MIKRILLLVIVIGGGMTTVAQNSIDTLFVSVSQRLSGHPSELIYLQTGKDIYETGEDLWFKAEWCCKLSLCGFHRLPGTARIFETGELPESHRNGNGRRLRHD